MSQEVRKIKDEMVSEPPDSMCAAATEVLLCTKTESEAEIVPGTIFDRIDNVESEMTNKLAPEVLFPVLPTELALLAKPTYKVRIGIGVHKPTQYFPTGLLIQMQGKRLQMNHI